MRKTQQPLRGETCAITTPRLAKQAALFFDRVFPLGALIDWRIEINEAVFMPDLTDYDFLRFFGTDNVPRLCAVSDVGTAEGLRFVLNTCVAYYGKNDVTIVPVYPSETSFFEEYKEGDAVAYNAVLSQIPVASEKISWDQVMEVRKDAKSSKKLRNMRIWLRSTLRGKTYEESHDILGKTIDDYSDALRKHGIETVNGVISDIISWEGVGSTALAAFSANHFNASPFVATLATGGVVVAKALVSINTRLLDLAEKQRQGADVAYLYEAIKLFSD